MSHIIRATESVVLWSNLPEWIDELDVESLKRESVPQ